MFRVTCFPHSPRCFLQKANPSLRRIGLLQKTLESSKRERLVDKEKHKLVYELNGLSVVSGIVKTKYSFSVLSAVGTTIAYFYFSSGNIALCLSIATVTHLCFIFFFARLLHNLVGRVYVNKEGDVKEVIVCAIEKSGRRVDRSHRPEDLLALSSPFGLVNVGGVVGLAVSNTDIRYKISLKACRFLDKQVCENLFAQDFGKESK